MRDCKNSLKIINQKIVTIDFKFQKHQTKSYHKIKII